MSRNFAGIPLLNYIGTFPKQAINICGGGFAVPLNFRWRDYGIDPNNPPAGFVGVAVNLRTAAPVPILTVIKSMYCDNGGTDNSCYVVFPDTGYAINLQTFSGGWFPVFTNLLNFNVYVSGFGTVQDPQTKLFPCEVFVPPFTAAFA
jgi:hypothetical protein